MLRKFRVYEFKVPNRQEYRSLIRGLAGGYAHGGLLFEVYGLDWFEGAPPPLEQMVASNKVIGRNKGLGRYACAHSFTYQAGSAPGPDGTVEFTDHQSTSLALSNLGGAWDEPNPCVPEGDVGFPELDALLRTLTRRSFSTLLFVIDGIPWFGAPARPATYGLRKARGKYECALGYLSPSIAVSVIGYERSYTVRACFEVTPPEGAGGEPDESAHLARLVAMLGRPASATTHYAPGDEADRPLWDLAGRRFEEEMARVRGCHDEWCRGLPHRVEGKPVPPYYLTPPYTRPENVTKATNKALAQAMKDAPWRKDPRPSEDGQCFVRRDRFGNSFDLRVFIRKEGYYVQTALDYCGAIDPTKMLKMWIGLGCKEMYDTAEVPLFFENVLALAGRYFDALEEAYGRVMDETGALAYFHPDLA
ncbi:MAG: hypothetical protein LBG81_06945 [Coriobacteriaceae bacterium]|nr:hypothetical protein [Coriobacteriaceae bacterium]